MNKDDTVYIAMLVLSIPIGFLFKYLTKLQNVSEDGVVSRRFVRVKRLISTLIGLAFVLIICGFHDILHSLFLVLTTALFVKIIHPK